MVDKAIRIVDDFLPSKKYSVLNQLMMGNNFPWFYNASVLTSSPGDNFQFIHGFYREGEINSTYFSVLNPLLIQEIKILSLIRAKANLTTRTNRVEEVKPYHVDYEGEKFKDSLTSILYVNTNDGYTKFENGDMIESVANKLVTFPTNMAHTSSTCTNSNVRIVIVLNYF